MVSCWVKDVESRGFQFEYHVRRGDTLLATAETDHIWVDATTRRPTRFPEELKAPFESYLPVAGARLESLRARPATCSDASA